MEEEELCEIGECIKYRKRKSEVQGQISVRAYRFRTLICKSMLGTTLQLAVSFLWYQEAEIT